MTSFPELKRSSPPAISGCPGVETSFAWHDGFGAAGRHISAREMRPNGAASKLSHWDNFGAAADSSNSGVTTAPRAALLRRIQAGMLIGAARKGIFSRAKRRRAARDAKSQPEMGSKSAASKLSHWDNFDAAALERPQTRLKSGFLENS